MYILASSVSDEQVPAATEQVKKFVVDFGGENVEESQLGKKKLAYPIKKTRNGYYVVVTFDMDTKRVNEFDAKIRTQGNIIRYLIVNLDEHLHRLEKDVVAQAKLSKQPDPETSSAERPTRHVSAPEPEYKPVATKPVAVAPMDAASLDKKIEEALTEDITK